MGTFGGTMNKGVGWISESLRRGRWVVCCLAGAVGCQPSVVPSAPGTHQPTLSRGFGSLPMTFEENVGQADARIKFMARGAGYQLYLTEGSPVFALHAPVD